MNPALDRSAVLAVLALIVNAFTWGLLWLPFRWFAAQGLHPLWATVAVYGVVVVLISAWRPRAWGQLLRVPALWWLVLAAGITNAAYNTAATLGDVVRAVLLFYLMPLWAVLLARVLLGERLTPLAALRVALALAGAMIVLWPADGGLPLPRTGADALAVLGGFGFALNNVMLRREAARSDESRALAMFLGGLLVPAAAALVLGAAGLVAPPPAAAPGWVAAVVALAAAFLVGNLALQYGAARLPANATSVVMVSEVVFAAGSAVALGAGVLTSRMWAGGALILVAALLAAWRR